MRKYNFSNINKYHLAIILILICGYIFSKITYENTIITNSIFIIITIICICTSENENIYVLFLLSPMFLYITIGTFPLYNVIILNIFIKEYLIKRKKINIVLIFIILCLVVNELLSLIISNTSFSITQVKFFLIIFINSIILYNPPKKYSNFRSSKYLIWGTFTYSLFYIYINYNNMLSSNVRVGGLGELDPNTYALYNLFVVAIIIQFILMNKFNKKEKNLYGIIGVVVFIAGLMTLSKTYIIVTAIMCILFFMFYKNKIKILIVGSAFFIMIYILLKDNELINNVSQHIMGRFSSANNLSELTTGRSDILNVYLSAIGNNIRAIFTGLGMYSYRNVLNLGRPHNSTIEIIVSWGIVGLVLITVLLYRGAQVYKKFIKYKKEIKLLNCIPLIIFIIFIQTLTVMYQEITWSYLVMGIMLIFLEAGKNNNDQIEGKYLV